MTNSLKVVGVFRPRLEGPGFGIPLARDADQWLAAQFDSNGSVTGLTPCDVNESHIRPLSTQPPRVLAMGKPALYAFEFPDGILVLGERQELTRQLRDRLSDLRDSPFVLHDVAEFLKDEELRASCESRCRQILKQQGSSATETAWENTSASRQAIHWEYHLVERPFCQQLQAMGWEWLEGDLDVPELTERASFSEVLLKDRLAAALRKINLRDGGPWLDDARIARAIRDLEQAAGHQLMEVNQSATELLLKGAVADGLPDWDHGRNQPVRFIDFEHPENNDFLVINRFKVELTSGRGHVIPDVVLFVNGIPLVVAEFKSPGIENPLREAINQLLRYSNQRRELFPTLYAENEGVERLFHTNQLLVASDFFEMRAGTIGAPPEAYLEWSDTSPVPLSTVAEELGVIPPVEVLDEAAYELAKIGAEQTDRAGIPVFFRKPQQRPEALRSRQGVNLHSQQVAVAGMLRPSHLLDLVRNFTVLQQVDGRTRKVVARYQQFRAVHKAVARLEQEESDKSDGDRDDRGGIIWHTQGSGKSLTMVFLVRKMRMRRTLRRFKIVVVTDRTDLEGQLSETANLSGEAVRPRRSKRRKTLGLTVDRGGELVIHSPETCEESELKRWARSKLLWVHRKLALKQDLVRQVREPEFVSGESFSYLGRSYQLRVVEELDRPLRFDGHRFYLRRNAKSSAAGHFRGWYIAVGRK